MNTSEKQTLYFGFRQVIYIVGCFAIISFQHLLAAKYLNETFHEHGVVENLQLGELLLTIALFCTTAFRIKEFKRLAPLFAGLCALATCRELDNFLGSTIPILGWKIGFLFVLLTGTYALKHWQETRKEFFQFIRHPAFGIMLGAMLLILPIAQCVGHKSFIVHVLQEEHVGRIKELLEESIETIGYFLLFCSAIELLFTPQRQRK